MSESVRDPLINPQQRRSDEPAPAEHVGIVQQQQLSQQYLQEVMGRIAATLVTDSEEEHGWSDSFRRTLETYERWGLFDGEEKAANALMSGKEVREGAPSMEHVLEALRTHPELLAKVEQGFTQVLPVPFGLSPASFREPMGKAVLHYRDAGKLRSSDGTKLVLNPPEPIWMWSAYEGADKNGSLVYFPEHFDPMDHGGKTKKQVLEASRFPGWQVLLLENMRDIPRKGEGQTVGGRAQIETNHRLQEYLDLLRTEGHSLEQGLTPEAWEALFLARLTESDGEVLEDNRTGGAPCYCTGSYFPLSDAVPDARWLRCGGRGEHCRSQRKMPRFCRRYARLGEGTLILRSFRLNEFF